MNPRILCLGIIISILLLSWSANPPQGNSGAPFDRTCARAGCHSSVGSISGAVDITGIPEEVSPGETYDFSLVLSVSGGNASRGGFQMVAVDSDDNDAGTLSNPGANATTSTFQGRTYLEHQPAKSFGSESELTYSAQWTAPQGSGGEESTFYISAMLVNGNGSPSGDTYVSVEKKYTIVAQQAQLQAIITEQTDVVCSGESNGSAIVTATGGSGTYTFEWDNGENTSSASMLNAGLHSVTVADGMNGIEVLVTISESEAIAPNIVTVQSVECQGQSNGILTASATGGAGPYNYAWSNGENNATINNLSPGLFNVTVTDANGCAAMADITLFAFDVTGPDVNVVESIDLFLTEDVSMVEINSLDNILLSSSDNCSDELTIDWTPKSFDCDDVGQRNLSITATDQSGNKTTEMVIVDVIDQVIPRLICLTDPLNISSCAPFNYVAPAVEDNCDNFRLELISGLGINSAFPIGQTIELYMVTDRSGNTATCEIIINNQPDINIEVEVNDISCTGAGDGGAQFVITGKNSPFSVALDGINAAENLEQGLYSFTVIDFTGCTVNSSFEINEPENLVITDSEITQPANSNSGDGSINVSVEGGTLPYTYSWMTEGEFFSDSEDLEFLFPGEYFVEVTDARGCVLISQNFLLEEITGINDPQIVASVLTYPNPVKDYLQIDVRELSFEEGHIEILSMNGQVIHYQSIQDHKTGIYLGELAGGVFLIKIRLDEEIVVRPLWKMAD